jgi:hypothetical protein
MNPTERIDKALELAFRYGQIEGDHHRLWVIDQMIRALTNCPVFEEQATDYNGTPYTFEVMRESQEYLDMVWNHNNGEDGPNTYEWDTGIAP